MKRAYAALARLAILCGVIGVCVACESVSKQFTKIARFIDGQDRIEMRGSTAEVTPLVLEDGDVFDPSDEIQIPDSQADTPARVESPSLSKSHLKKPIETPEATASRSVPPQAKVPPVAAVKRPYAPASPVHTGGRVPVKSANKTQLTGAITGQVLVQVEIKVDDQDMNKSIVRLIPLTGNTNLDLSSGRESSVDFVIDMKDKTYQPRYLAAKKNDTVVFTNSDKIRHNVFSRSGKNAFDLGTYAAGKKRGVTFKEDGIVKVYCNIHPNMATFVSVSDEGYSTITDEHGTFSFDALPVGDYTLEAWNIRGKTDTKVSVLSRGKNKVELVIGELDPEFKEHRNKFGEKYPDKPVLFEDEFY